VANKEIIEKPTGDAVELFNELHGKRKVLAIFHITC